MTWWRGLGGGLIASCLPVVPVKGELLVPYLWGYRLGWVGKRLLPPVFGGVGGCPLSLVTNMAPGF